MTALPWRPCGWCSRWGWEYQLADGQRGWRCWCGNHRVDHQAAAPPPGSQTELFPALRGGVPR
jgi:hypothetical protein